MLTSLFVSTTISIIIVLLSFFILSKSSFFLTNRLLFLSIISGYSLGNAVFISSPNIITMIGPKFIDVIGFGIIIFAILLTPILSKIPEQNKNLELSENDKNVFFVYLLMFLAIHTIAEAISIGMTYTFFQNINIGELIIDIIHEAPEISLIICIYYFYTKDKSKTLNLVFLVGMLYPIGTLITTSLISYYNPGFISYIKGFLLGWYIVFSTILLFIFGISKNKHLYISIFLLVFMLMFGYKLLFGVS